MERAFHIGNFLITAKIVIIQMTQQQSIII